MSETRRHDAGSLAPTANTGTRTVVVTIQHPAHVHFYKHAMRELERRNHDVHVFVESDDTATDLLDVYGFEYEVLGERGPRFTRPARQAAVEYRLWRAARRLQPDVMTGVGGVAVSHVAPLVGARSVVFTDNETKTVSNRIAFPFADEVLTPDCYADDHGSTQVRYTGCHELAYLHPDRFSPDPSVLGEAGLSRDDRFVVLRHGGWGAVHEVGDAGFDDVAEVVRRIESAGVEVRLTSDATHPPEVADRGLDIATDRIHDLLAYADLFVGESGTMALESAVLGTPAVYIHPSRPGIVDRLDRYGLLYTFHDENRHEQGVETAIELVSANVDWDERRREFVEDHVDTTDVVVDRLFVED